MSLVDALLWLALSGAATAVPKPHDSRVERAWAAYKNFAYDEALQLTTAITTDTSAAKADKATAHVCRGAILFTQGRPDEARAAFAVAVQLQADVALPPGSSPRLLDLLEEARLTVSPAYARSAPLAHENPDAEAEPVPRLWTGRAARASLWLGGASLALATVGGVFGYQTQAHKRRAYEGRADWQRQRTDGQRDQLIANVSYGLAAAAALSGAAIWLLGRSDPAPAATVSPLVGRRIAGLGVNLDF